MEVKQDNLEVVIDRGRSIEELRELSSDGTSVLRTCHIGNLSAHNMSILDAGIPAWLVDYSRVGKDGNYQPENVIKNGEVESLTSTRGEVVKDVVLEDGQTLDELHADSARLAFPATRIETASEYIRRHAGIAREIIEITMGESDSAHTSAELDSFRIGTNKMLLITFIAEALESQKSRQFHIGGSHLHKYIGGINSFLRGAIESVREYSTFSTDIPEDIEVSIVPAEHAVFATSADRQSQLDEMVEALVNFFDINQQLDDSRGLFFRQERPKKERAEFAALAKNKQHQAHEELRGVVAQHGSVIADRSTGSWVTQYDVAEAGGLYSHPLNHELTMAELQKFNEAIRKAKRQIADC